MKKQAFTLIELLVVIVIIGILATISTATFNDYNAKARDAERIATVRQLTGLVLANGAATANGYKYLYNGPMTRKLLSENGYTPSKPKNNFCYYIHVATNENWDGTSCIAGTNHSLGCAGTNNNIQGGNSEDNEFVIMTWGETTSTNTPNTPGVIFQGTPQAEQNIANSTILEENDFACIPAGVDDAILSTSPPNSDQRDSFYGVSEGGSPTIYDGTWIMLNEASKPRDPYEITTDVDKPSNDIDLS